MNETFASEPIDDFEDQLRSLRYIETGADPIEAVELEPPRPESEVPIILLGGVGANMDSTTYPAKRLYDAGRKVVLLNHPVNTNSNTYSVHPDIHPFQNQQAENVVKVVQALGHERYDVIAQSGASLYAVAAILKSPDNFRTLVIESGAGLDGPDSRAKLVARFAIDGSMNVQRYLKNRIQSERYIRGVKQHIRRSGLKRIGQELRSVVDSKLDRALQNVRKEGVKVAVVQAASDRVFPARRVSEHIQITEDRQGNADSWSSIADKKAPHGSLLFDQIGVDAALVQIRQFEMLEATDKSRAKVS